MVTNKKDRTPRCVLFLQVWSDGSFSVHGDRKQRLGIAKASGGTMKSARMRAIRYMKRYYLKETEK